MRIDQRSKVNWRHLLPGLLGIGLALSPASGEPQSSGGKLVGHYYLSGMTEVGSELLLTPDGRFQWMLAYGARDASADGSWTTDGRTVTLVSRQPSADDVQFQLGEKGGWSERAGHFLEHRRERDALSARERACPLPSLSREVGVDIPADTTDEAPSATRIAEAQAKTDQTARTAQAALGRLKARPNWQGDRSLVDETDKALSDFLDSQEMLAGLYGPAQIVPPDTAVLDLPQECRLTDWKKQAVGFRGVAIPVFDPQRDLWGDGIQVEAHYDEGPPVSDIVQQGYAFFPLPDHRRITAITLHVPDASHDRDVTFQVALAEPAVQPVSADLGQPSFARMVLTINADGSLTSDEMFRLTYRKANPE